MDFEQNGIAAGQHTRLDSWKEIAAYLQRDVRTARRWELKKGSRSIGIRIRADRAYTLTAARSTLGETLRD